VDIYEAKNRPSGLALYGCAPYKVTNRDIEEEIGYLQKQFQFNIHFNHPIDTAEKIKKLEKSYDAIFLGIGLGATRSLSIPGEDLESFAEGFDRLVKLRPHEIQVGVLKRLKGTPIIRHTNIFDMTYNPAPPYNLLSNRDLSFSDIIIINLNHT